MRAGHVVIGGSAMAVLLSLGPAPLGAARPDDARAQPGCTPETIATRPGRWMPDSAGATDIDDAAPAALRPAILKRLWTVGPLFREAYPQPVGTQAQGWGEIRRSGDWLPGHLAQYAYESAISVLECGDGVRPRFVQETGGFAYVYFNSLYRLLDDVGEMTIDGKPTMVYALAARLPDVRGEAAYSVKMALTWGTAIVFAHDGRLPWRALSQKEYLEALARYYDEAAAETNAGMDEFLVKMAEQIAEARKTLPPDMRDEIVAGMERALAQAKAQRASTRATFDTAIAADRTQVTDYLASHRDQELAQPAYLYAGVGRNFQGEFGQASDETRLRVVIDPTYFKTDLTQDVPQVITVMWKQEGEYEVLDTWLRQFESRFPFEKLKALLDR
ncbi:MAG: hypothetical protein R2708_07035 [Vicinamibacterales bacterium]